MKLRTKTFAGGFAIALLLSSAGAISQVPADINLTVTDRFVTHDRLQRTVNYGDLDLDRPQGIARLHQRLESAVRHVCDPFTGQPLGRRPKLLKCMDESMSAAVASVNNARLTAFHAAKGGSVPMIALNAAR
jgi:UrcA family protein